MRKLGKELPDMLTIASVSKLLHLAPRTIRKYIESNELPALKVGNSYRIPKDWLLSYLNVTE